MNLNVYDNLIAETQVKLMKLQPDAVNKKVGNAVMELVRNHLFAFNKTHPNQMGGKRTNFYSKAAKATTWHPIPGGLVVETDWVGINQRVYGGTITPVTKQWLTIPAIPEAYGRTAREFQNLRFIEYDKGKRAMLIEGSTGARQLKGKVPAWKKVKGQKQAAALTGYLTRVYYWLVKSVTQQGDPTVMPSQQDVQQRIDETVQKLVNN